MHCRFEYEFRVRLVLGIAILVHECGVNRIAYDCVLGNLHSTELFSIVPLNAVPGLKGKACP